LFQRRSTTVVSARNLAPVLAAVRQITGWFGVAGQPNARSVPQGHWLHQTRGLCAVVNLVVLAAIA
jgi:hypothetical protein